MKNNQLKARINDRRMDKLRLYARKKNMTMTQVIEQAIDNLPEVITETEQEIFFQNTKTH